jgi:hypothetical protein
MLLLPTASKASERAFGCKCCCFTACEKGVFECDLRLERQSFAPGELLPLSGMVRNSTGERVTVSVSLVRHYVLSTARQAKNSGERVLQIIGQYTLEPKCSENNVLDRIPGARIPPCYPSFYGLVEPEHISFRTYNPVTWCYRSSAFDVHWVLCLVVRHGEKQ